MELLVYALMSKQAAILSYEPFGTTSSILNLENFAQRHVKTNAVNFSFKSKAQLAILVHREDFKSNHSP